MAQTNVYGEPIPADAPLSHTYTPPLVPAQPNIIHTLTADAHRLLPGSTASHEDNYVDQAVQYVVNVLNELENSEWSKYTDYLFYLFLLLCLLALYSAYQMMYGGSDSTAVFDPFAEARKHDELRAKVEKLSNIDGSQVVPISKAPLSVLREAPFVRRQTSSQGSSSTGTSTPRGAGGNIYSGNGGNDSMRQRSGFSSNGGNDYNYNDDLKNRNKALGL